MTKDKSIQTKIDELNELVRWFQGDDFRLEDAKDKLRQAAELSKSIETDLVGISNDIHEVKRSFKIDSES